MALSLILLDDHWRPVRRVESGNTWPDMIGELLVPEGQWLVIEQRREQEAFPRPKPGDIRLTRALMRQLRPLDVLIADHVIKGKRSQFSFRSAGLL